MRASMLFGPDTHNGEVIIAQVKVSLQGKLVG